MRQSDGARDMIKSGGGKTGSRRRAASSRGTEDNKTESQGVDADIARLRQEADELREALASEQQRTKRLEATNATVADRLNRAIASIRQLLERQG